jgi:hypothetical protein
MEVSFISGGNQNTRRKPPTRHTDKLYHIMLQMKILKTLMHLPNMTTLDHKIKKQDNHMKRNSSEIGFLNQHSTGPDTMKIKEA